MGTVSQSHTHTHTHTRMGAPGPGAAAGDSVYCLPSDLVVPLCAIWGVSMAVTDVNGKF